MKLTTRRATVLVRRRRVPRLLQPTIVACWMAVATAIPCSPVIQDRGGASTRLTVRVVDEAGSPVEGACLRVGSADVLTTAMTLTKPHARSSANGRLTCSGEKGSHALLVAKARECVQLVLSSGTRIDDGSLEMGTVVLRKGVSIQGLIRTADGEPVVGARVTSRDIFRSRHLQMQIPENSVSYATTNEKGRFRLDGVPARGVSVQVRAEGFMDYELQHANRYTPVVAALTEAGTTTGKVVDAAGEPVAAAWVRAYFEHSEQTVAVRSADDGTFSIALRYAGRYRISASAPNRAAASPTQSTWSETFRAPAQGVRVEIDVVDETVGVSIRAKSARGGAAVTAFRAAVIWANPRMWKTNQTYLENSFKNLAMRPGKDGELVFPGPRSGQPSTGRLVVRADGFAPKIVDEVEWDEEKPPEFHLELQPESAIEGVVVDEKTGEPIVGATVYIGAKGAAGPANVWVGGGVLQSVNQTSRIGSVRSDAKGRFRIDGIGAGNHFVQVSKRGRPNGARRRVKVGAAETKTGVEMTMPKGVTIRGRFVGAKIGRGWRARVQRPVQSNVIMLPTSVTPLIGGDDPTGSVTVDKDGKFVITGLSSASLQLTLLVPYPLGMLEIPIEKVRVRSADIEKEFDISDELPGRLHGKIDLRGAAVPPGRLMVLATRFDPQPNRGWSGFAFTSPMLSGVRALVRPDGRFELPVRQGQHVVKLVDLATGVTLFQSSRIPTKATKDKEFDIATQIARVDFELVPESGSGAHVADRLELQVTHPNVSGQNQQVVVGNGIIYDRGVGIDVRPGQTTVSALLPKLLTKIYARSRAYQLDPAKSVYTLPPLGQEELVPEPAKSNKIQIPVGEPDIPSTSK